MDLGFFAADTLGVTLYQVNGKLKGKEIHQIKLGPWRLGLLMEVESDVLGAKSLGFWVTLGKSLRAYLVLRETESWLFFLNTETLRQCGEKTGFAGETIKARVQEFKPAISGLFRWKDGAWEKIKYDGAGETL